MIRTKGEILLGVLVLSLVLLVIFGYFGIGMAGAAQSNVVNENLKVKAYTSHSPIRINSDSDFTSENGIVSGSGTKDDPYIISGWDIDAHGAGTAIYIGNTTAYFVVKNCNLHNTSYHSSDYEEGSGIMLYNVINGIIIDDTIYDNYDNSIYLKSSSDNEILNNMLHSNSYDGIDLERASSNTITNNSIYHVQGEAIALWYSSQNTLSSNSIYNNSGDGVDLEYSSNNSMKYNILSNNSGYGVYIDTGSNDNLVYANSFYYNAYSGDTYNSWFIQAYDNGTDNHWNSSSGIGNYWYDWANNNDTNDQNNDGIVDWPYKLAGDVGAEDYYPLKTPYSSSVPEFSSGLFIIAIALIAILGLVRLRDRH